MKFLIAIAFLATAVLARPQQHVDVTQDTLGNYKYDVLLHGISRAEEGHADGTVSGAYKYIDANGVLQHVEYIAGPGIGFKVKGTNLPREPSVVLTPVGYTPEVLAARQAHLALFA